MDIVGEERGQGTAGEQKKRLDRRTLTDEGRTLG